MRNLNVPNAEGLVDKLVKQLNASNDKMARMTLAQIKKQAQNKEYKLRKKIESGQLSGDELVVAQSMHKEAERNLKTTSEEVAKIREYLKSPKGVKVNSYINKLNVKQGKIALDKARVRAEQKKIGGVNTSLLTIKTAERMQVLIERLVYSNKLIDLDEALVNRLDAIFVKYLGISLKQRIQEIFKEEKKAYGSLEVYEAIMEFAEEVGLRIQASSIDKEGLEIVKQAYQELIEALQ